MSEQPALPLPHEGEPVDGAGEGWGQPEPDPPGSERDRLARIVLGQVFEPGSARVDGLVRELGAARLLTLLGEHRWVQDVSNDARARLAQVHPERDLERAEAMGVRYVVPGDDEWPACFDDLAGLEPLHECSGPPLGVWVRGPHRLDEVSDGVAIVGSRAATTYGVEVAGHLGSMVVQAGHAVVSGLAYGIDQAAHRGALAAGGVTISVLANGVDRAYPSGHERLLDAVAAEGLVLSELAPGTAPTRIRFLTRNRLIAALGRGTVVVEAAARSGALNTANWTSRLHRALMAVPGEVTSAASRGAHQLVRMGAATLVTSPDDVLEVLGASGEHLAPDVRGPTRTRDKLAHRHQRILEAVPVTRPAMTESIARTAGMGLFEVRGGLDQLARGGLIELTRRGWRMRQDEEGRPVIPD